MVTAHRKAYLEAEAKLKVDREEMARRNQEHMDALAKEQPSPTIAEVQKAMGVTPKVEEPEAKPAVEEPKADDKADKASTADKSPGGNYKTRDLNAKK